MPKGMDDAVRAYQLPSTAPEQQYLSQYNLAPNTPIYVTAGFANPITAGDIGQGLSPAIQLGGAHYDLVVTFYMEQAATEAREKTT